MRFLTTLAIFFALLAPAANAADAVTVTIEKFAFTPKEITVTPGTKVTWINKDETPHTINTADKRFMSKAMDTDDTFEQTFVNAGDFSYFCTLHPFMTGIVHVRADTGAAKASTN
jgi:plastocyanin